MSLISHKTTKLNIQVTVIKFLLSYLLKLFSHKVSVKNNTTHYLVHGIFCKTKIISILLFRKSLRIHTLTQNIKEENANGNNQKERHGTGLINKQTILPNIVSWPICILFLIFYQPPSFLPAQGFMIYRLFPNIQYFSSVQISLVLGAFYSCIVLQSCVVLNRFTYHYLVYLLHVQLSYCLSQ